MSPTTTCVSRNQWIDWAESAWMDIRETNTLNVRGTKGENDTKHICPLQLDVIERAIELWTNRGEVVVDPFAGVGSTVYGAVTNGRKGIGMELKPSYYRQAVKNLATADSPVDQQRDLLSGLEDLEPDFDESEIEEDEA